MAILKGLIALLVISLCAQVSIAKSKSRTLQAVLPLSNRVPKSSVERDFYFQENPPSPAADHFTVDEDAALKCFNVVWNDVDVDGDLDTSSVSIVEMPAHGTANKKAGSNMLCYQPVADFYGADSFKYEICDDTDLCSWAEVRITVNPVNDRPVAMDDSATVGENEYSVTVNVLHNDHDVDGFYADFKSLRILEAPCHGVAVVNADRSITYTPEFNDEVRFVGEDSLVYQICDIADPSYCTHATVTFMVVDKCIACELCGDYLPTFNAHLTWLDKYYHEDVLSVSN